MVGDLSRDIGMINRVLIVGLGSIGKRHLRLARNLIPNAEIAVLRHRECTGIPEHADHVFSQLDQAIAFAPQVAVIANPAPYHLSCAVPLARAGVHLIVEKPLATSTEGVPELIEIGRMGGLTLMTGYNLRYSPSLIKFKEFIDDGVIGDIWSIQCEAGQYLPLWRPDADYRDGVSARLALGGGALLELSHELDYLRWIFGEAEWVQATLSKQSDLEIDVEDSVSMDMQFARQTTGTSPIASVNLSLLRHDACRICTVVGKLGCLKWDGIAGSVELFSSGGERWVEMFRHVSPRDETYEAQWRCFLQYVTSHAKSIAGAIDGFQVMRLVELIKLSGMLGQRLHLNRERERIGGLVK